MIKSFRGLLQHEEQETIRLGTNQGLVGYTIVKFQLISNDPKGVSAESVCKIFTREQDSSTALIDFDDGSLLGVSYFSNSDNPAYVAGLTTIFDNIKFNQDIYVTMYSALNTEPCNYYIELEQVQLDVSEAAVATLKDMRGSE